MMGRRRGPGLVGAMARTAVVVGPANAEQAAPVQEAAPAAAPADDLTAQLEALAKLRDQGILTEDEFSAKKAQILGI